jgi:hypothetical protein
VNTLKEVRKEQVEYFEEKWEELNADGDLELVHRLGEWSTDVPRQQRLWGRELWFGNNGCLLYIEHKATGVRWHFQQNLSAEAINDELIHLDHLGLVIQDEEWDRLIEKWRSYY